MGNIGYATSKILPAFSSQKQESLPPVTKSSYKKNKVRKLWDYHAYYQGGKFPHYGGLEYIGAIKYRIPTDHIAPTDVKNPDHFTRKWWLQVTVVIKKRNNLSVYFPIEI